MRPSTIARIALVILALGFVVAMIASGHLDDLLILTASILVTAGLFGIFIAASGVFDR